MIIIMKKVLSIGQCSFDNHSISSLFKQIGYTVVTASNKHQAISLIQANDLSLILINRIFDATGESGLDFIKEELQGKSIIPYMLVSNYPDAQSKAVELGAQEGFGKSIVTSPRAVDIVKKAISHSPK